MGVGGRERRRWWSGGCEEFRSEERVRVSEGRSSDGRRGRRTGPLQPWSF